MKKIKKSLIVTTILLVQICVSSSIASYSVKQQNTFLNDTFNINNLDIIANKSERDLVKNDKTTEPNFETKLIIINKEKNKKLSLSLPKSYIESNLLKDVVQENVFYRNYVPKETPECCRFRVALTVVEKPEVGNFNKLIDMVKDLKTKETISSFVGMNLIDSSIKEVNQNDIGSVITEAEFVHKQDPNMLLSTWSKFISTKSFTDKSTNLIQIDVNYTHYKKFDLKKYNQEFEDLKHELNEIQLIGDWS